MLLMYTFACFLLLGVSFQHLLFLLKIAWLFYKEIMLHDLHNMFRLRVCLLLQKKFNSDIGNKMKHQILENLGFDYIAIKPSVHTHCSSYYRLQVTADFLLWTSFAAL